jgi:hypothetical protein
MICLGSVKYVLVTNMNNELATLILLSVGAQMGKEPGNNFIPVRAYAERSLS